MSATKTYIPCIQTHTEVTVEDFLIQTQIKFYMLTKEHLKLWSLYWQFQYMRALLDRFCPPARLGVDPLKKNL